VVSAHDATRLYRHLSSHAIPAWVTGGWGVDALLGEQTRPHKDLDILVLVDDEAHLCELLACDGYGPKFPVQARLPARLDHVMKRRRR
jgi:lincosamide nucleotidyltransferase A/C/D/E